MNTAMGIFYIVRIVIRFLTSYVNEDSVEIRDPVQIRNRYLRSV